MTIDAPEHRVRLAEQPRHRLRVDPRARLHAVGFLSRGGFGRRVANARLAALLSVLVLGISTFCRVVHRATMPAIVLSLSAPRMMLARQHKGRRGGKGPHQVHVVAALPAEHVAEAVRARHVVGVDRAVELRRDGRAQPVAQPWVQHLTGCV